MKKNLLQEQKTYEIQEDDNLYSVTETYDNMTGLTQYDIYEVITDDAVPVEKRKEIISFLNE